MILEEDWICTECETVSNHPGSRRWRATGDAMYPVTLFCPTQHKDTKHWRESRYRQAKARESRQLVAKRRDLD
jgi:hypothetical protein